MEPFAPLLEKTRAPQPSLQRHAVNSIFSLLRSSSPSSSSLGVISQCLNSSSPPVVDQSVHELCRLVSQSKFDLSVALLELQSSLEGAEPRLVNLFVKALGFLVRLGLERKLFTDVSSVETHPFIKILSCRADVQVELLQQILLLLSQNDRCGMLEVCKFLRPFLNFAILRIPFLETSSALFVRHLISSMASLCCSLPFEGLAVLKFLLECLIYIPSRNTDDFMDFIFSAECLVDAYCVILRHLSETRSLLITEAQLFGLELVDGILSRKSDIYKFSGESEALVDLTKRLLVSQKELGLKYVPDMSRAMLSLFVSLSLSDLEHEQLTIVKLLLFLLDWKSENTVGGLNEEHLFVFPLINLMSSPSKRVKGAVSELLLKFEKLQFKLLMEPVEPMKDVDMDMSFECMSTPEMIVYRLLQRLLIQDQLSSSSYFFLSFAFPKKIGITETYVGPISWLSCIKEYSLWICERRKSSLPLSYSQESFSEISMLVSAVTGVLVLHDQLSTAAVDSLAALGIMDAKMGVALLLAILFYINMYSRQDISSHDMVHKLLRMLPSVSSHSMMVPLVVQTILPMLQKDSKPVLYATAARLLCKTWECNDRSFGALQAILLPKEFSHFETERTILVSMAACIRDICIKNPDRAVDLILSVSACIENRDPIVHVLGLESLAHLCEADVIDFYTAWDVIARHILDYQKEPIIAPSLCLLLKCGAMDAEAYPEVSTKILKLLWEIGTTLYLGDRFIWTKSRAFAFEALTHFEVMHIERRIPDFKQTITELITSETECAILNALEAFVLKIIAYEHITRRRLIKEKKVLGSKVEKLLDVFPQVIFSSGRKRNARELPGAALLCLDFIPRATQAPIVSKGMQDFHVGYENAMVEISASLHLSRNIFIALLTIESWKSFMLRWLKADILSLEAKVTSKALDITSKAANDILKSMRQFAEESIPRASENCALAIGALCLVLPSSAHAVKAAASKFLLGWLVQYEHEHRQWSAAVSLGLISSCLHVTDHELRQEIISELLEVACNVKSLLVRGACGVGLGFSCQDLLTRAESADNSNLDKETYRTQEADLLGKTVRTLSLMICQVTQSSSDLLLAISAYSPTGTHHMEVELPFETNCENTASLEEDIWGVTGLIMGLGSCITAVYKAGPHDAVLNMKSFLISLISSTELEVGKLGFFRDKSDALLSVGSCLILPSVVAFCRSVELMDDGELRHVMNCYKGLISILVNITPSNTLHQNLLMASCIGAGNLLSCISHEGLHFVEAEDVENLLDSFRKCYSNPYPSLIHLGGMLGVVNALGAGTGNLIDIVSTSSKQTVHDRRGSASVTHPLLSSPLYGSYVTSLMQEIFLVSQNSDDSELQQYASWAVSLLRHHLWSEGPPGNENTDHGDPEGLRSVNQTFSEDSAVMKLCLWLMQLKYSERGHVPHVNTVAATLRCLSHAPRLPALDWGAISRRCMRYEAQVAEKLPLDSTYSKGNLRVECLGFTLVHANKFDVLQTFLDELCDLPRFGTLELNLQSYLLLHLSDLIKLFSGPRLVKLFDDIADYFSSPISLFGNFSSDQKSLLKTSCWKGLGQCQDDALVHSSEYISHMETCMKVLFYMLPAMRHAGGLGVDGVSYANEWSGALQCLGKARRDWLLGFLQVHEGDKQPGDNESIEMKKMQIRAKLISTGILPLAELGTLKSYVLNSTSCVKWDVLVEVVATLQQAEGGVKKKWLLDAVESSCMASYPSKALQLIALLSGSFCKYMALLILDELTVLSDLPVTLPSLLSAHGWDVVAEPIVSHLFTSTERVLAWARSIADGDNSPRPSSIDPSEDRLASYLVRVLHRTCVLLKDHLPLEKQLRLANMVVSF